MHSYANLTLVGPSQADVVAYLKRLGTVAYVAPTYRNATVVYHEDLASQEPLAAELSQHFECPVLLVMTYATRVLLYVLFDKGQQVDAYVSEPHEDLTDGATAPPGDPERVADMFSRPTAIRRLTTLLSKPGTEGNGYAYAANRHGDLCAALNLPTFAVNVGFASIEMGELPAGEGFDPAGLVHT
ncbi:MAG TPA: hypothetical protein VGN72_02560 [Tepidisphaeraceae bacterium]|jgi:hypothetical protein|nr:hypothetical protein [Tepidisphaeraceae bacterium]